MTFYVHVCPLIPTQPPSDFKPPAAIVFGQPDNGWYHGQLRETEGVFNSQYVQFRYSCKLISNSKNLPTSLCTSDTVHLLSVNHAVLCSDNVRSIAQCYGNCWCDKLLMSITSRSDVWVGLSLLSWFINKHYGNLFSCYIITSSAFDSTLLSQLI